MGKFPPCCCPCISLRTAVFSIGVFESVTNSVLVLITSSLAGLAWSGKLIPLMTGIEEGKSPIYYHNGWVDPFFVVFTIFTILFLTSLGCAIGLIVGVQKSSRVHLKNWRTFKSFSMTVFFVLSLQYILFVRFSDLLFLFGALFLFAFNIYLSLLVKAYRQTLKHRNHLHNLPPEMQTLTSNFPTKPTSP